MYLYFRAYITFKTRGEAKKCVEDTKDMTVEDRKVRLQLNGKMNGICGPHCEKTCLRGVRPGHAQTSLLSYRD